VIDRDELHRQALTYMAEHGCTYVQAIDRVAFVETSVKGAKAAQHLRDYWAHGAGAAKIGWGAPGDFMRCVREVRKFMRNPEGYCQERHHDATGAYAGHAPGEAHAGGSSKHSEALREELTDDEIRALVTLAGLLGVDEET
jgi:hypothetical protein